MENFFVNRFLNEYKNARLNFLVTEDGYGRYAQESLPDWHAYLTLTISLLWVLLSVGYALYLGRNGNDWQSMLIIPGLIVAFFISTYYPASMLFSILFLILSIDVISVFPHWLFGGSLGFYALTSLVKRISKWYALDRIERLAVGCDEKFLLMLKNGSIKISLNKYSKEATDLIEEIKQHLKSG